MIETKVGSFEPESRLLIGGELVEAASGARFDNINPATEEVLGQVADGGHEDMRRAIGAARRAFDETDWPENRAFRAKCLEQLQEALEADPEQLRAERVAETGTPVPLTYGPAPDTPWNATRLGRLVAEKTDIPAGVVNVVAASDHLVGEDLTLDPRVDLISFTGSTVTGKRIMEKGAATLKRVFLELGGKSAMIVCHPPSLR